MCSRQDGINSSAGPLCLLDLAQTFAWMYLEDWSSTCKTPNRNLVSSVRSMWARDSGTMEDSLLGRCVLCEHLAWSL